MLWRISQYKHPTFGQHSLKGIDRKRTNRWWTQSNICVSLHQRSGWGHLWSGQWPSCKALYPPSLCLWTTGYSCSIGWGAILTSCWTSGATVLPVIAKSGVPRAFHCHWPWLAVSPQLEISILVILTPLWNVLVDINYINGLFDFFVYLDCLVGTTERGVSIRKVFTHFKVTLVGLVVGEVSCSALTGCRLCYEMSVVREEQS